MGGDCGCHDFHRLQKQLTKMPWINLLEVLHKAEEQTMEIDEDDGGQIGGNMGSGHASVVAPNLAGLGTLVWVFF